MEFIINMAIYMAFGASFIAAMLVFFNILIDYVAVGIIFNIRNKETKLKPHILFYSLYIMFLLTIGIITYNLYGKEALQGEVIEGEPGSRLILPAIIFLLEIITTLFIEEDEQEIINRLESIEKKKFYLRIVAIVTPIILIGALLGL